MFTKKLDYFVCGYLTPADEYAASIVRDIYRLKLEGMSAQKIADYLNSLGILSPMEYKRSRGLPFAENCYGHKSDARWSAKTVLRILGNETYIGTLVQGRQTTRNYKVRDIVHKPESEWIRTENAHEPIVSKLDFDLVRRIMRLDTSTSKNADAVYLFSGILICGCCGGPMTHKTNRVGGKEYHYYFCPTTKRQGCSTSNMVKQQDLDGCVLESIKSHIVNVASLDALLSGGEGQRMASALAAQYRTSIDDNRAQLETIRSFKSSLYENMVNGVVSKDDYKLIRGKYNDDEERLRTATEKLTRELDDVLAGKGERIKWTDNFKRFEDMQELDRRTVINLIQSIKVISKTELRITFNYQLEYDIAQHLISAESPRNQAAGCFDGEEDDKRNEANARRQASAA